MLWEVGVGREVCRGIFLHQPPSLLLLAKLSPRGSVSSPPKEWNLKRCVRWGRCVSGLSIFLPTMSRLLSLKYNSKLLMPAQNTVLPFLLPLLCFPLFSSLLFFPFSLPFFFFLPSSFNFLSFLAYLPVFPLLLSYLPTHQYAFLPSTPIKHLQITTIP